MRMNSNKSLEWLLNPFTRLAGWKAFGLGIIASVVMAVTGSYSSVAFDGVLDAHFIGLNAVQALSMTGLSLTSLVLVFWLTGLIVAKPFRLIDLAGTMILAKAPYIFLALIGFLVTSPNPMTLINQPSIILEYPGFLGALFLSIPITIWSIVLMFNAYKTSCGLKERVLTISFIVALIIAEGISKMLIFLLM